jgi:hypothetical protein
VSKLELVAGDTADGAAGDGSGTAVLLLALEGRTRTSPQDALGIRTLLVTTSLRTAPSS